MSHIIFWQPIASPHQEALLESLAKQFDGEVIEAVEQDLGKFNYLGLDIDHGGIDCCRRRIESADLTFRFALCNVHNERYNPPDYRLVCDGPLHVVRYERKYRFSLVEEKASGRATSCTARMPTGRVPCIW